MRRRSQVGEEGHEGEYVWDTRVFRARRRDGRRHGEVRGDAGRLGTGQGLRLQPRRGPPRPAAELQTLGLSGHQLRRRRRSDQRHGKRETLAKPVLPAL